MAERPPDEAFAQQLLKVGLATEAQIREALREQAGRALKGARVSLAQILVEQGVITAAQREGIEKKLESQREEARRLGPYRVIRKLGEGGMGVVYLAEETSTGEKVALKVLPKVAARQEEAVRRFLREVESARKLEHPNIVGARGWGEDRGYHYYAMEYVAGETLGARLKREEFVGVEEATRLVLQVAEGLRYAHERGYIHRDIKPENVIVTPEGVAKILDMGLSKNIEEGGTFRTVTGAILGTPHYMAPEQARGDKGIDGRADIYSLGATYYHLVTGETPFHGTTAIELIAQHLNKQLPDPRDIRDGIPEGVVHIIRRMMAKRAEDRYRDCTELITDLELVLRGREPSSQALEAARSAVGLPMEREARERYRAQRRRQGPGTVRATSKARPDRVPLVVGAACVGVAVVLLLVFVFSGGSKPPKTEPVVAKAEPPTPPPKVDVPQPRPPPPKTARELREEEAQEKLERLWRVDRSGRFAADEIRRRYGEFAREYADTPQGRTIGEWLKATEAKPERAAVAEVPQPEEPKPPEPPPPPLPMPPEPKEEAVAKTPMAESPETLPPAPREPQPGPVVKPPEPGPTSRPAVSEDPAAKPPGRVEPPPPGRRETRKPVPDAAGLKEAEAALRKAFRIEQARSPAEKGALARELLQTASTSGAKDAELYVMLTSARDLAAQAGEVKTALEAIEAMAGAFEVNGFEEKAGVLTKTPVKGVEAAAWARTCLEVSEGAEEAGEYEAAVKLASRAETLSGAAKDATLLASARERMKELQELKWEAERLNGHFKTLEANADDPGANTAVGRFLCLIKEEWEKGLPMLAKGSDGNLRRLAEQELGKPAEAVAQAALGEGWAAQANKEVGRYKAGAKARAVEWLEKAIPALTGLAKVSAQKTLASLGPSGTPKAQMVLDLGGAVRMEFVYIKPGVFTMGGTEAPKERWQRDERPPHKVEITRGFYLGKYEVTQAQWEAVMGSNPSKWRGPDLPVEQVSWEDCQNFLREINKKVKSQLRGFVVVLPKEAQWEYACRAGTTTRWSFGDEDSKFVDYGWFERNSEGQTHPVGRKKANPWGLFDMHGNVWEWVQDWHGPYGGDARDPEGPSSGSERCVRGGGWSGLSSHCRSALRADDPPKDQNKSKGFRACLR